MKRDVCVCVCPVDSLGQRNSDPGVNSVTLLIAQLTSFTLICVNPERLPEKIHCAFVYSDREQRCSVVFSGLSKARSLMLATHCSAICYLKEVGERSFPVIALIPFPPVILCRFCLGCYTHGDSLQRVLGCEGRICASCTNDCSGFPPRILVPRCFQLCWCSWAGSEVSRMTNKMVSSC